MTQCPGQVNWRVREAVATGKYGKYGDRRDIHQFFGVPYRRKKSADFPARGNRVSEAVGSTLN